MSIWDGGTVAWRGEEHRRQGWGGLMARKLDYRWHLRQVMADRGMFATTDLIEPLAARGIRLSSSQVYRLPRPGCGPQFAAPDSAHEPDAGRLHRERGAVAEVTPFGLTERGRAGRP
jgi:hypothetical protein